MQTMTSAYANKMLKSLEEDKAFWLNKEEEACTYVAAINEEPVVPDYDYVEVATTIAALDEKIAIIKHELNVTNANAKVLVGDVTMSIDSILIKMAQLPKAVENPSDIEARDGMATAQYIAGMAFSNVGLGLVHGMAHPLGAYYDIPHGVANALLLPFVMEYNKEAAKAKYRTIAEAMGVDTSAMDDDQAAQAAVDAVKALAVKVRIPQHLSELGVPESGLPTLAQAAFNDVCTPGNPRKAVVEEILEVYKKAF